MDCPGDGMPPWEVHVPRAQTTAYCKRREDALLYAAAPELLAVCERMISDLSASHEPGADTVTRMQAAIAKARGGA